MTTVQQATEMEERALKTLDGDVFDVAGDAWEECGRRTQADRARANAALARFLAKHDLLDIARFECGRRVRQLARAELQRVHGFSKVRHTTTWRREKRIVDLQQRLRAEVDRGDDVMRDFVPLAAAFIDGEVEANYSPKPGVTSRASSEARSRS